MKLKTGIIGWRGMVGSVLIERMRAENDFKLIEPLLFSTSQTGQKAPDFGFDLPPLEDAYNIEKLKQMDVIM